MFKLDIMILNFIKRLIEDPYIQLITVLSIYIFLSAILPEEKKK